MRRLVFAAVCGIPFLGGTANVAGQSSCDSTQWTFETRLTVVADDALPLGRVWDLEVGPDGGIYLSHGFEPGVLVLSEDGTLARVIGGAGSGPGEFADAPRRLAWRADTLVAGDRFNTLLLNQEGREVRRVGFSTPAPGEASTFVAGTPLADGSWLGRRLIHSPTEPYLRAGRLPLLRFSDAGEILDTITFVRPPPAIIAGERNARGSHELEARHPLFAWSGESGLPVVPTKDGTAVIHEGEVVRDGQARPALIKVSITSDTIWVRQLPRPEQVDRLVGSRLREAFGALRAGDYATSSSARRPRGAAERLRSLAERAIEIPSRYPAVRQIVAGDDGSVWVLLESKPQPQDVWGVYDRDGLRVGTVSLPEGQTGPFPWTPRMLLLQATVDSGWGVTYDQFGVPTLHALSVTSLCGW